MTLNGVPVDLQRDYRVAVQDYLGGGGDNFSIFTQGRNEQGGELDLDALVSYVREQSEAGPMPLPLQPRIQRIQ